MALQKDIVLDNGVTLTYHRIVSINKITNNQTLIEVASYINKEQREKEKEYYESQELDKAMNVFIDTTYESTEYDEVEQIEDYYAYLKTTEKFKDAIDV